MQHKRHGKAATPWVKRESGELRDKVAAPDPEAVPAHAEPARRAQKAVPLVDPDPTASARDYPAAVPHRVRRVDLVIATAAIVLLVAVAGTVLALTL